MIRPSFPSTPVTVRCLLAAALIGAGGAASAGTPYPHATTPAAQDAGALARRSPGHRDGGAQAARR
jgi:hypothetical protein